MKLSRYLIVTSSASDQVLGILNTPIVSNRHIGKKVLYIWVSTLCNTFVYAVGSHISGSGSLWRMFDLVPRAVTIIYVQGQTKHP